MMNLSMHLITGDHPCGAVGAGERGAPPGGGGSGPGPAEESIRAPHARAHHRQGNGWHPRPQHSSLPNNPWRDA
jgi:hypothetical protein